MPVSITVEKIHQRWRVEGLSHGQVANIAALPISGEASQMLVDAAVIWLKHNPVVENTKKVASMQRYEQRERKKQSAFQQECQYLQLLSEPQRQSYVPRLLNELRAKRGDTIAGVRQAVRHVCGLEQHYASGNGLYLMPISTEDV